jgi:hypothetical protein
MDNIKRNSIKNTDIKRSSITDPSNNIPKRPSLVKRISKSVTSFFGLSDRNIDSNIDSNIGDENARYGYMLT